ncbi:MAG: hypothetical protein PVI91_12330 [Gammaproteobacteria bacterium]
MYDGLLRREEIVALGAHSEHCAVHFEALSRSFVRRVQRLRGKRADVRYNEIVRLIRVVEGRFLVETYVCK